MVKAQSQLEIAPSPKVIKRGTKSMEGARQIDFDKKYFRTDIGADL